jgi:hypothetical protein
VLRRIFVLKKDEVSNLGYHITRKECEIFTALNIQVEVFQVVMLCSVAVGYQYFRGPLL